MEEPVGRISAVTVAHDDVLVFSTAAYLTGAQRDHIHADLKRRFPNNANIILDGGATLVVYKKE